MTPPTHNQHSRNLTQNLIPVLQKFDSNNDSINNTYVRKNQFKIGRARDNDEVICKLVISRYHCLLECDNNEDWTIRNFSSNGTILNGHVLGENEAKSIEHGDVVQLSAIEDFKYYFKLRFKEDIPVKRQRTEPQNDFSCETTFRSYQEAKCHELENKIAMTKNKQEDLRNLLEKNQRREKIEFDNDILADQINCNKAAIESAELMQKVLEKTYTCYIKEMDEERCQLDMKVKDESEKLQRDLKASSKQIQSIIGQRLEQSMGDHKYKWSEIIKSVMREEKLQQKTRCGSNRLLQNNFGSNINTHLFLTNFSSGSNK